MRFPAAAACAATVAFLAGNPCLQAQSPAASIRVVANPPGGRLLLTSVLPGGAKPVVITPTDVNGDGHMDLAVADYVNSMMILTNDGAGGFSIAQNILIGESPTQLAARDLNGDGRVDLVSCNSGLSDNNITVLTNTGPGVFIIHRKVPVGRGPVTISSGDLNLDGTVDIVTADYGSDTVTVLTNDGRANLTVSQTLPAGAFAHGVDAIDVNLDGHLDIVATSYNGSDLRVYTNNHAGRFAQSSSNSVPGRPRWQVAGDFDHDGFPDVATSNAGDGTVTILLNKRDGTFRPAAKLSTGIGAYGIGTGDVDGDGSLDLVVASMYSTNKETVAVFRNNGTGEFALMQLLDVANSPYSATIADLDKSGGGVVIISSTTSDTVSLVKFAPRSALVSWPSTGEQYSVEQCADLSGRKWVKLPESAVSRGQTNQLKFPLTGKSAFFRLVK